MKKEEATIGASDIAKALIGTSRRRHVPHSLAEKLAAQELNKGRKPSDAEKEVKSRLHQVLLSFEPGPQALSDLAVMIRDAGSDRQKLAEIAKSGLMLHSSTKERIGFISELYSFALKGIQPGKVLDLACGLNPLALPWMGIPEDVEYLAVDASGLCGSAVEAFFRSWGTAGRFLQMDLAAEMPVGHFDLAFVMKALPTLDRIEAGLGMRCLERADAEVMVVSFPTRSLGGSHKGMAGFYGDAFEAEAAARGWAFERADFPNELVYRVRK